jgi:hypothetical protein
MQITPSSNLIAALSALQQPQRAQPAASTIGVPPVSGPTPPVFKPQPILPQQTQPADPGSARPPNSPLGRHIDIRV